MFYQQLLCCVLSPNVQIEDESYNSLKKCNEIYLQVTKIVRNDNDKVLVAIMNALKTIYAKTQPKVYAYFYVKISNQSIAEDLTQDVFYEACKVIHSFSGHSTLQTWLFSIAKNVLRNYYRSKKYQRHLEDTLKKQDDMSPPLKTPEESVLLMDEVDQLLTHVQQLVPIEQEIVILRIYGDLSFKEIGQLLQRTENYARVTFHRIKLKLQKEMRRNEDD